MELKSILLVLHVIIAISLIGFILIQHGKGADAGAAFGGGSSSTVFGSRGSSSFLSRTTAYLATLFFVLSFTLYFMAVQASKPATKASNKKNDIELKQPTPKKAGSEKSPAPKDKSKTPKDTSKSDSTPAPKSKPLEGKANSAASKSAPPKKESSKSDAVKSESK